VLWHIHELEYALNVTMGSPRIQDLFPLATRFVAVSKSGRDALIESFEIPKETVDLVHGSIAIPTYTAKDAQLRRREIRNSLGWPQDAFVIGGCGAIGWRKGTDVFLQIARSMLAGGERDRVRFLWIGGATSGDEALRFDHDVRGLGLTGVCQRVPTTAEVIDYYYAMDVFALTSREDPFPLVMLEAASCRLPIVCFEGSGGGKEFVGADAGLVAPYLDVNSFVRHLETLLETPTLLHTLGLAGAEKVRREHIIETQGPKLLASIQRCLSPHGI
jgi:glycosyltransferase involved in cell wall biosynthesis